MASIRYRDVFKVMCFKLGLLRPAVTVRQTGRKDLPLGFERLEPRQLMSRTTLGGSLSIADEFVGPRAEFKPAQSYSTGLQRSAAGGIDLGQMGPFHPSVYSPPSGRESGYRPPSSPPTSPVSGYTLKTSIWGDGINNPKIMEGDDFIVRVDFLSNNPSSPSYPRMVNVGIWADIDFDNQIDPDETQWDTTAAPGGFVMKKFRALDDGPWPGNGTPGDVMTVRVSVDLGPWQTTQGAWIHNVKPMFEEPPKYQFGVDEQGRNYVEVTAEFWDPSLKDLYRFTLETSGLFQPYNFSSGWLAANGANAGVLKHFKYRFYTPKLEHLGDKFTLTVEDDDTGLDERWNLWQSVKRNDNDSNSNFVVDLLDRNLPSADPDIVELGGLWQVQPDWLLTDAEVRVPNPQRPLMLSPEGELVLFYDPAIIRIWDSPKKEKLFAPYMGISNEIGHRFTGHETLWIEGYNKGSSEVYATWTPNMPGYFVNEYMNRLVSHSFTVQVAEIDVDIDSDNDDVVKPDFERDDWNEYLEDSPYALGKFVGSSFEVSYVPFVVQLDGLSSNQDHWIQFSVSDKFEVMRFNNGVIPNAPITSNFYRPSELGIVGSGLYTFWVRRKYPADIEKYVDNSRNSGFINVRVISGREHSPFPSVMEDGVKILGIYHNNLDPISVKDSDGEFPMALQANTAVRSAGAADLVYSDRSDSKYALKKLDAAEVEKLLRLDPFYSDENLKDPERKLDLEDLIRWLTVDHEKTPRVRVFLDHCDTEETKSPHDGGGRYIVSFQGTVGKPSDWISNIGQAWDGASNYHEVALRIGHYLRDVTAFRYDFAGHSLGGGLAAAAALNSNREANTFNAAGLNPDIFVRPGTERPQEYVKYGKTNYETPGRREDLITAYVINDSDPDSSGWSDCPDVLTWLQRTIKKVTGHGFVADGRQMAMEGLHNLGSPERHLLKNLESTFADFWSGQNVVGFNWDSIWAAISAGRVYFSNLPGKLVESHGFPHLFYGLLHDDELGWNAYDRGSQR